MRSIIFICTRIYACTYVYNKPVRTRFYTLTHPRTHESYERALVHELRVLFMMHLVTRSFVRSSLFPSLSLYRSIAIFLSRSLSLHHLVRLHLHLYPLLPPPLALFPLLPSTPFQRAFFNLSRGTCSRDEPHTDRINLPCFYEQFLRSYNRSNSWRKITTIRIPRFHYSLFLFTYNHGCTMI